MSANKYYVYQHFDNNGNLFYIGKGKNSRCFAISGRTEKWLEIASKGITIKILKDNLSNHDALKLERDTIYQAQVDGVDLANIKKVKPPKIKKVKPPKILKVAPPKTQDSSRGRATNNAKILGTCIATGENKTFSGKKDLEAAGFSQGNVSSVCSGRYSKHKGWIFKYI